MISNVLVLNSGSSSVKYRLFRSDRIEDGHPLASDVIQRIGEPDSPIQDHRQAIRQIVQRLEDEGCLGAGELRAVGHRVVHGGEAFDRAVVVDEPVLDAIRRAVVLAPLHNPANLLGIEACRQQWPAVPQVAVFDTAFHQTLPEAAFRYAIPSAAYREHGIRRYGFHGTSFAYITRYLAEHWGRPRAELNLIVLHLGNGASACAIRNGRSINTSMGMTPLAGLMMGTRCGDIDPGVLLYWQEQLGAGAAEVSRWLNRDSGLKGIAGTNDMRDVLAASGQIRPRISPWRCMPIGCGTISAPIGRSCHSSTPWSSPVASASMRHRCASMPAEGWNTWASASMRKPIAIHRRAWPKSRRWNRPSGY